MVATDQILESISAPAQFWPLTTSDSKQDINIRGLFVGTGGDIVVKSDAGEQVTFKNVPDGSYLPIITDTVYTATTASDLVRFR